MSNARKGSQGGPLTSLAEGPAFGGKDRGFAAEGSPSRARARVPPASEARVPPRALASGPCCYQSNFTPNFAMRGFRTVVAFSNAAPERQLMFTAVFEFSAL